jgi:hypothetical protein
MRMVDEKRKKYRLDNKVKISAYQKEWRLLNRNAVKDYKKEYESRTKENVLDTRRAYYASHKEQVSASCKKWASENKEWIRNYSKKRNQLPEGLYSRYKYNAKIDGRQFDLTMEQFNSFWQKDCHYCGRQIEKIGLDRVDNSRGYVMDNIVSCCKVCNTMKMNYTLEQFLNHIRAIASHQLTKQTEEKICS